MGFTTPPPETDRLRFREYTMDDLPLLLPVLGDAETMEFLRGPRDGEGAREWLESLLTRYERDGHCFWAVELKEPADAGSMPKESSDSPTGRTTASFKHGTREADVSGTWIGHCGLLRQHIDGAEENEVAYTLKRDAWGHGYATEAARAVKAHAFAHYGYERVVTIVHPNNARSIRVALKNGMELWKRVEWHGVGVNVYAARE